MLSFSPQGIYNHYYYHQLEPVHKMVPKKAQQGCIQKFLSGGEGEEFHHVFITV